MTPTAEVPEAIITLCGVTKGFTEAGVHHLVLDAVDLRVAPGSFVAILGRSGSGKSTLLNLVGGIDSPDAGEVVVAGRRLQEIGEQERSLFRRRHVGFVFQFFNLLPTLTVEENVRLPLELNRLDNAPERANALLCQVGLESRGSSFPDRLSGGEQQRVAIARALAHDPEIVLADEPTGNLDAGIGRDVMDLLRDLSRDKGKTLLVATHSKEVADAAHRVLRIEEHNLVDVAAAGR